MSSKKKSKTEKPVSSYSLAERGFRLFQFTGRGNKLTPSKNAFICLKDGVGKVSLGTISDVPAKEIIEDPDPFVIPPSDVPGKDGEKPTAVDGVGKKGKGELWIYLEKTPEVMVYWDTKAKNITIKLNGCNPILSRLLKNRKEHNYVKTMNDFISETISYCKSLAANLVKVTVMLKDKDCTIQQHNDENFILDESYRQHFASSPSLQFYVKKLESMLDSLASESIKS